MFGPLTELDPASFGDPLALKVNWEPLRSSLLAYGPRAVAEPAPGRTELRPTARAVGQAVGWMIPGVLLLAIAAVMVLSETPEIAIPFAVADAIAALPTGAILLRRLRSQVFDRGAGLYWTGPRPAGAPDGANSCRLQSVHALQVVQWKPRGRGLAYRNELNLVLKDARRVPVICVDDLDNARQCAAGLRLRGTISRRHRGRARAHGLLDGPGGRRCLAGGGLRSGVLWRGDHGQQPLRPTGAARRRTGPAIARGATRPCPPRRSARRPTAPAPGRPRAAGWRDTSGRRTAPPTARTRW